MVLVDELTRHWPIASLDNCTTLGDLLRFMLLLLFLINEALNESTQ